MRNTVVFVCTLFTTLQILLLSVWAVGGDFEIEASAAVGPFLVEGEVVKNVVLAQGSSSNSGRPQFLVRVGENSSTPGGRQFRVFYEHSGWSVVEHGARWVEFGRSGPNGIVELFAPLEIETASSILSFVEPQLKEGEYPSSVRVCEVIESGVNAEGESFVSGLGELEGCAAVWIFRGTGQSGRVLGVNFQGEAFTIVQTGNISR